MNKYIIKQIPEDFLVNELPNISISFLEDNVKYYLLSKKGFSTFDVIELLCNKFRISKEDISYAGLKDEYGITSQYISISKNFLDNELEIYSSSDRFAYARLVGYGKKHMKVGELYGNGFTIVIRKCDESIVERITLGKQKLCYINYYDMQRFGLPQERPVTHLLGKAIIENNSELIQHYLKLGNQAIAFDDIFKENFLYKRSFYMNSWESYLWNLSVSKTVEENFLNTQVCEDSKITFRFINNSKDILQLKNIVPIKNLRHYFVKNREILSKVGYRDTIKESTMYINEILDDELNIGKKKIVVNFNLGKGEYATMLIRQFIFEKLGL